MNDQERFFYEQAGWNYDPATETSEQGRERCAKELAAAELEATRRGWSYNVEHDPDVMFDDVGSRELVASGEAVNLAVDLFDADGEFLDSLSSIVVSSEFDPYVRVVKAELASNALAAKQ